MPIEFHERPTIMDGSVVTYATGFRQSKGILGPLFEATGPFEISASRNAVIVHHAWLTNAEELSEFEKALKEAVEEHWRLKRR